MNNRDKRLFRIVVLLIATLWALQVYGAEQTAIEGALKRGFDEKSVFASADLDNVNLFNGNLNISIPLGQTYQVGPNLSYQLALTYNSRAWDFEEFSAFLESPENRSEGESEADAAYGIPMRNANAGLGWELSFGRLYPADPTVGIDGETDHKRVNSSSGTWLYVSPDGAQRKFYAALSHDSDRAPASSPAGSLFYTRDSSFLRMEVVSSTERVIEFPDGTEHRFTCDGQANVTEEWCWRLRDISDQFGNMVSFEYNFDSTGYDVVITEDPAGSTSSRQQTIRFKHDFNVNLDDSKRFIGRLDTIELTAFDDTPASYSFGYQSKSILRGCHPTRFQAYDHDGTVIPELVNIPFLTEITRPDGSTFELSYKQTDSLAQPTLGGDCERDNGRLTRIVLPTGGAIEWDYGAYRHAAFECDVGEEYYGVQPPNRRAPVTFGVTARRALAADLETVHTETRYQPSRYDDYKERRNFVPTLPGGTSTCYITSRQFTNSVKSVFVDKLSVDKRTRDQIRALAFDDLDGDISVSYFNLYNEDEHYNQEDSSNDNPDIANPDTGEIDNLDSQGWKDEEYGLPFTRYHSNHFKHETMLGGTAEVYLSSEQYDCSRSARVGALDSNPYRPPSVSNCYRVRAGYVTKAWDAVAEFEDEPLNVRTKLSKTRFWDDERDGEATWTAETRSGYTGFGNYEKTVETSNFNTANSTGSTTKESTTEYSNPGLIGYPWLLGLSTAQTIKQYGKTAKSRTCYDTLGFVTSRRTFASWTGSPASNDVVVEFQRNSAGHPVLAFYHGGDSDSVQATHSCSHDYGAAEYVLGARYTHGVVSRLSWLKPNSARANFSNADELLVVESNTVDANTSLVFESYGSDGVESISKYDVMGRVTSESTGNQVATTYTYCLATQTDCQTNQVKVSRNDPGPANAHDNAGPVAIHNYDALGRPVHQSRRIAQSMALDGTSVLTKDAVQTISYDKLGRAFKTSAFGAPDRFTLKFYNRGTGSVTKVKQPDETSVTYQSRGSRIEETRSETATSPGVFENIFKRRKMDQFGQTVVVQECHAETGGCTSNDLVSVHYGYDPLGNITSVGFGNLLDGDRALRKFKYDGAGRLRAAFHPELDVVERHSEYDSRGKVLTTRFERRQDDEVVRTLSYTYDQVGRLTQLWAEDGDVNQCLVQNYYAPTSHVSMSSGDRNGGKLVRTQRHTHTYLREGDLTSGSLSEAIVSEIYAYRGPAGQMTDVNTRVAFVGNGAGEHIGSSLDFASSYTYDTAGLLTHTDYPDCAGSCADLSKSTDTTYLRGSPVRLSIDGRVAGRLTYHPTGELATIRHDTALDYASIQHFTPDPWGMGRLRRTYVTTPYQSTELWDTGHYHYDASQNVYAIGANQYAYDLAGRLIGAETLTQGGGTIISGYQYDSNGNLTERTVDEIVTDLAAYADSNRLKGSFYDAFGNKTNWGFNGYSEYDAQNMPTAMTVGEGDHIRHRSFIYGPGNYRLASIDLDSGEESWTLRNGGQKILREYTRENHSKPLVWSQDNFYIGSKLFASDSGADGERHYYSDHLGNTRLVTNENAQLEARYDYLPYGQSAYTWHSSQANDVASQRFTGHERDLLCDTAGLCSEDSNDDAVDYMLARYYLSDQGRFTSVDPVLGQTGSPQSWNRYRYASANPIAFIDPDGQLVKPVRQAIDDYKNDSGQLHQWTWSDGQYVGMSVDPSKVMVRNLFINGMANDPIKSGRNGAQQLGFPDQYHVFHNRSSSFMADGIDSALMKAFGGSTLAEGLAGVLTSNASSLESIVAHSQGTLILSAAMRQMEPMSLMGVPTTVFGPAVSRGRGNKSAAHVGSPYTWVNNPDDGVGNILSGSPSSPRNFFRSLIAFPRLFQGEGRSPHSIYIAPGANPVTDRNLSWWQ